MTNHIRGAAKVTLLFFIILLNLTTVEAATTAQDTSDTTVEATGHGHSSEGHNDHHGEEGTHEEAGAHHNAPAGWSVIPFVLLLLMIATGPLFYEHFWHKNYPVIAVFLAILVVVYYLFVIHNTHTPVHSLAEYIQFIALLSSLYIASGGIIINVDSKATPKVNVMLLLAGAVIANVIGTTGASMVLIRPFLRLNKNRIKAYHVIFFIFIVSNIGGSLTPIGDPPLFLGFLKGVPFFWTMEHNILPWMFALVCLLTTFFVFDKRNKTFRGNPADTVPSGKVTIQGSRNFLWLGVVVVAVFIDPNVIDGVPYISYHGAKLSYIRELIMFSVAFLSYKTTNPERLRQNQFDLEPIREVAFLFIGIFGTMMPALELVGNFAQSPSGSELINHNSLFWGTGLLSGFLDNAPTYLNFLAAALSSQGGEISVPEHVTHFAQGIGYHDSILDLKAVSVAAVFFGAFTYIGNGPNFMVKSIAESIGIKMPSFFGYILHFSLPILIPLFILVWLVFFAFA